MEPAQRPNLFSVSPEPTLNGGHCRACGYVFFPPQSYGCEFCGAPPEKLEPKSLKGEGVLSSFATFNLHQDRGIETPFTVGVIVLDDGPAIRAVLTHKTDKGLKIGDRTHAVVVADDDERGGPVNELRFAQRETQR
ncbi:MAG TPA: OB-fold domain-containing protein [Candidatus Binataceae bacterium]